MRPVAHDWTVTWGVAGYSATHQTKGTKMPQHTMVRSQSQVHNKPNVHAVMVPMSQPIGGWHVTSMTGRSRSTLPNQVSHEYRDQT